MWAGLCIFLVDEGFGFDSGCGGGKGRGVWGAWGIGMGRPGQVEGEGAERGVAVVAVVGRRGWVIGWGGWLIAVGL